MRLLKRTLKIVVWTISCLILVTLLTLTALKLYFNDERLARLVTSQLNTLFAGNVSVREIHWVLPFHLSLDDVAIDDPAGRPAIRVTHIDANIVWRRALARTIAVSDIAAHGVDVRVLTMPGNPDALGIAEAFAPKVPSPPTPDNGGPSIDLDFTGSILDRVEFIYDADGITIGVAGGRLEDVELGIFGNVLRITGHVTADRLDLDVPGILYSGHADVHCSDLEIDLGPSGVPSDLGLKAAEARAVLDQITIAAHGDIRLPHDNPLPQGTLTVDATLPLDHHLLRDLVRNGRGMATVHADTHREGDSTDADVTIKGDNAVVDGIPIDEVAFKGKLEPASVDIHRFAVVMDGGSASVSGELTLTPPMAHDLTLELERFPAEHVMRAFEQSTPVPARLSGHLHARGDALAELDTHVRGEIKAAGMPHELAGVPDPTTLDIDADIGHNHADVQRFTVQGDGARLDVDGRIPFDMTGRIDANLALVHKQPNATLNATGTTAPVSIGECSLIAKATGTRTSMVADATLDARQVIAHGWGPVDLHVPFHVEHGTAELEGATMTLGRGGIAISAAVGVFDDKGKLRKDMSLQASVKAHDVSLAAVSKSQATGFISIDGNFDGTVQAPHGELRVAIDKLSAHGVDFAKADTIVDVSPGVIELEELALAPSTGGYLNGRARYTMASAAVDADLTIADLPLHAVMALTRANLPLRGTIAGNVRVSGTADEPNAKGAITISDLATGFTNLGTLKADIETQDDIHAVVELAGPLGNAKTDAHLVARTKHVTGTVSLSKVGIAPTLQAAALSLPLAGSIDLNANVDGTLPYPAVEGALRLSSLQIDGESPETNEITVNFTSNAQDTSYAAQVEFGRMLSASARIWPALSTGIAAELSARFEELRISAFSPRLQRAGFDVQMSGETMMRYAAPKTFHGTFTLNWLEASFANQTVSTTHYVIMTFDGQNVDIPRLDLAGSGSTLSLEGGVRDRAITGDITGDLNLALIAPFVTAISDPSGVVHVTATARGTVDAPKLSGEVSIAREVRARPRGLPQELALKSGVIHVEPDSVVIDDLEGGLEDGTFTLSGRLGLTDFKPSSYNLILDGKHLTYQNRELQVEADAKLTLTGDKLIPDIKGRVLVVTGRYFKKFALKDFNFVGKRPDTAIPLSQTMPQLKDMHLDLHVKNAEDFDVNVDASAFAIRMPLQVDLHVTGTPLTPSIGGKISAQAGAIKFPYANLTITETLISFTPGLPPADGANLSLVAEGEVPSRGSDSTVDEVYLVQMNLSGTLSQLQFDLSASPGLDRNQTLALLVTGKAGFDQLFYGTGTASQTTGTASGNSNSPEVDAAIALAGAGVTGPLTGFVENQLEDRLNLKLNLSASVTSDQLNVTARKELTPRLRIEGSVQRALQASGNNLNVATATFVLGNRWFLQAIAQAAQQSAAATDQTVIRPRSDNRIEMKYRLVGD